MKAYVCREFGPVDSHKVEEIEDPRAEPGMVVVDVKAAGVSFPDVLIVQGKYQFQPPFPFSPGGEIAGVISEVGEGVAPFARSLERHGWGRSALLRLGPLGLVHVLGLDDVVVLGRPQDLAEQTGGAQLL